MDAFAGQIGGDARDLTEDEVEFLGLVLSGRPWLDVWRHADEDGTPWLIVSVDLAHEGVIVHTFRLDFDGSSIVGGRSPASLNWDSGVRADVAGINTSTDGIRAQGSPLTLAKLAGDWFEERHRLGVSS